MIERILELLKVHGITAKKLTDELELSNSAITDWKKGKARPSTDAIIKISKYFNVSADYILTGKDFFNKDNISVFDENEATLLSGFRKLNIINKEMLINRLEVLLEAKFDVENTTNDSKPNVKHIPILGETISEPPINVIRIAGKDYVEVPEYLDVDYAFFSKDESMFPQINYNDLIFIKAVPIVESGTISLIDLDGSLTCRKFYPYNDRIEFVSINNEYNPITYFKSFKEIQGIRTASISPRTKTYETIKSYKIIGKVSFAQDKYSNFFAL